jgi:hypothetical protein
LPQSTDNANNRSIIVAMMSVRLLVRLRRLSREHMRLRVCASALLATASAGVSLLPFRYAIRFGCVPVPKKKQSSIEDIVGAVEAVARRVPWRTMCIEKGLVVQRMLRSSGVDAVLHYGARMNSKDGSLEAHVWVSVSGRAVVGGESAADYADVASYP